MPINTRAGVNNTLSNRHLAGFIRPARPLKPGTALDNAKINKQKIKSIVLSDCTIDYTTDLLIARLTGLDETNDNNIINRHVTWSRLGRISLSLDFTDHCMGVQHGHGNASVSLYPEALFRR